MPNTISDNLQRLQTARTSIANAITTKGGIVNSGDGYEEFPTDIASIPTRSIFVAFLFVTAPDGKTVTVSKGQTTLPTQTSTGSELIFEIPSYGEWTVTDVDITKTISITEKTSYYISLNPIYGVSWDKSSSTTLTRTDDASNFSDPDPYVADGNHPGSSPFDNIMPWFGMVKETIDGNVFVKIPKFWYKITNTSNELKFQIANEPEDGFKVSPSHRAWNSDDTEKDYVYVGRYKCNSNYGSTSGSSPKVSITRSAARTGCAGVSSGKSFQMDFATFWTIRMLYLVEFANWNSQAVIGYGCGQSSVQKTGASDSMPYHTGTIQTSRSTYGVGCQYRWIEDLWGNVFEWVDGIRFSGSTIYAYSDPSTYSDSSGGTNVGTRPTSSNIISNWIIPSNSDYDWFLYPSTVVSSSYDTYVCDSCGYNSSGVVLYSGGYWNDWGGLQGYGLFYPSGGNASSYSYSYLGSRLLLYP